MRTSKFVLLLGLFLADALTAVVSPRMSASALDFSSVSIDPNDIQQFEQSYESWVQSIVQGLVNGQNATVLIEVGYTQNPERLQTYGELKATQHLPGLPEVMDPHITHPSESPLSALVESRKIKIIFEHALSAAQEKIVGEVLNSKLRINANAGDQLIVSTLEAAPATETSNPWRDPKNMLYVIAGSLLLAAFLARGRKKSEDKTRELPTELKEMLAEAAKKATTPPPAPVKPFKFTDADRTVINRMMQVDSGLLSKTSSIVSPTQIILKSEPKAVIRVVRAESPQIITQAIQGSSILFQKTVLSICTPKQRNEIREIAKKETFKKEQTLFAQNLLAAKIYRELQNLSLQAVDTFVKSREALSASKEAETQLRNSLNAARARQNQVTNPVSEEQNSEAQL